ncbi:MAG TPA: hypothetical protein VGO48_15045 [Conexibacter sp.]|jgi:hypothetical protein|nr:hypothetical protein [Conexibacter sp.]
MPLWARAARSLAAHQHRTAAGLFALLVLAYLWPVLIGGNVLLPSALLYGQPPWASGMTSAMFRYFNGDLADVPGTYHPWAVLARQMIHEGTFPAWNPFAFAGTQLFANSQLAWLSPFSLPLWILPLNYAFGVTAALKLWLAGFGTYLFVRELRLGFWPALLAGISFALCAFNVVWLTYGVFVSVSVMLPWTFWLAERIIRRGRAIDALALVAVVAVLQAGGHPGTQVHILAALALYVVVRLLFPTAEDHGGRLRALGLVAGAVALGTLLLAVVLLPAQQASVDTAGAVLRKNGGAGFRGSHVPVDAIRTALFPDWWGRPSEQLYGGGSNYRERTFYAGVLPLLLAMIALVSPSRWRTKAPLLLLGALGVAVPLRAPGVFDAVVHVPLLGAVQDQRMLLLFLFATAILAAFGLRTVLDEPRARRTWAIVGVGVLAVVVAALSTSTAGATAQDVAREVLHRARDVGPATLALASVAWWLIFVVAFAGVLLLARRGTTRARLLAGGLAALLVAFDLLHFAHGYNPMGPARVVIPQTTPAITYMQRHVGDGRIGGLADAMQADWSTMYGLRDVRGRDAPQPSLRFAHMWSALDPLDTALITRLSRASLNVLGLLGARLLLAGPDIDLSSNGVRVAYSGADAAVYRNPFAVQRAFVPQRMRVARSDNGELLVAFGRSFDPRRDVVVRDTELGTHPPLAGEGNVRVVREENAHVRLRAHLRRTGLVVLDDQLTPGWSVRVDGRPARPIRSDIVLRGVWVPAGDHTIDWEYRVPGLRLGAALSATALAIVFAWAILLWTRRRSAARRPGERALQ